MLEYADQFGVLSWIDGNMLTVIDSYDKEKMLLEFVNQYYKDSDRVYKRLPELMEDLPPRGPPRPRPPETLLPLPPGRLLLSR